MGNLLGSPITEKDTHVGTTHDSNANDSESPDGGGMQFGISSMQGWRIHMEDAHIAQPFLYAEKLNETNVDNASIASNAAGITPCKKTAIEATLSEEEGDNNTMATEVNVTEKTPAKAKSSPDSDSTSNNGKYIQIPLPNHSLFAVFDGHGGSFAAEYASRNLLRVLCRSTTFCEYAEKWRGREDYFAGLKASSGDDDDDKAADKETPGKLDDNKLQKRGRDSDEKVKQIKEQVRKHLDGGKAAVNNTASTTTSSSNTSNNGDADFARATYDHELMTLLEHSLRDAFLNLDAEILREVRGEKCEDANMPYAAGYDLSQHSLQGCVGHLPKEAGDDDNDANKAAESSSSSSSSSILPPFNKEMNDPISHPVPSDDEDAGTTAVAVMVTPKWIVCTNAGDSRAVYSRSNHRAVPLSYDHKPEDEDEERRIREAGGYVSGGRVEGDLAVSRGLGDYRFKDLDAVLSGAEGERTPRGTSILQRTIASTLQEQGGGEEEDMPMLRPSEQKVSPVPDIIVQNRDPKEDEFIVIACDGIWDVLTNQECVRMVADIFGEGEGDLGLVCEEVLDLCLIKGSKDNMTAAVIKLPKQVIGEGGGVPARRERRGGSSSAANNTGESGGNRGEQQPLQGRVYNPYVPPAMRDGQQEEDKGGDDDQWEGSRG